MTARTLAACVADPSLVVLDGFHAVKHAQRFGAELVGLWTTDAGEVERLRQSLAPDLAPFDATELTRGQARAALGATPVTPLVGAAVRPVGRGPRGEAPVVCLVDPHHLGNVGAVVRAAAAADAAGVVVAGDADPWARQAVRGGAGLQFAMPVARTDSVAGAREWAGPDRPVVAMTGGGVPLTREPLPRGALLLFGTEREGLTPDVVAAADRVATLPMRAGVSSLNLATAVAATLYLDLVNR